jgi:hypothetical protein
MHTVLRRCQFACATCATCFKTTPTTSVKLTATALVLAAGTGLAPAASAAAATGAASTTALALSGYSSLVADSVHGHVFVSGTSTDPVVVTDFTGAPVATLSSLTGANSLALSADSGILYAALSGTDEIAAVNTATLQEVAVYFTGAGHDPEHLAVAGHDVWFGYGSGGAAGIGELDPSVPAVTVNAESAFYDAPLLAASPSAPDTLVAGNGGMSPSVVESFDVASGTPAEIAESDPWTQSDGCENLQALAISESGTDVVAACGSPYHGSSLSIAAMTEDAQYQTGPYVDAVAVSAANGTIALGVYATSSSVDLFTPGDATPTATYQLGGFGVAGLAWDASGTTLFAVTDPSSGSAPSLNVVNVS